MISFMNLTIYISIYLFPYCVWSLFCLALLIMLQWITNVLFTTLVVCWLQNVDCKVAFIFML